MGSLAIVLQCCPSEAVTVVVKSLCLRIWLSAAHATFWMQAAADPPVTEDLLRTLKVTWDKTGSNGYGVEQLRELFSKHGNVEDIVLRNAKKKTKGSALVMMQTLDGAIAASEAVNGNSANPLLVVPLAKAAGPACASNHTTQPAAAETYAVKQAVQQQQHSHSYSAQAQHHNGQSDQQHGQKVLHDGQQAQQSGQHAQQDQDLGQHDAISGATPPSSPNQKPLPRNPFGGAFNPAQSQKPLFNGFNSFPAFPTAAPGRPIFAAGSVNGSFGQSSGGPAFGAGSYSSFPGMCAVGGQAQASMQDAFGHVQAGAKR